MADINSLSIDVLELLGMVMTACVMIFLRKDTPEQKGGAVFMRGDNESAVQWIRKCYRGNNIIIAGGLMRKLGVLEEIGGGPSRRMI